MHWRNGSDDAGVPRRFALSCDLKIAGKMPMPCGHSTGSVGASIIDQKRVCKAKLSHHPTLLWIDTRTWQA
jgi:hypothetical protein